MSQDIYVNITRSGTAVASNVRVQLDLASPKMAADYQSTHPFDTFEAFVYYLPPNIPLQRSDLFTDIFNSDPLTSQPTLYRLIDRPEPFPDGHVQCMVAQFQGANT